MWFVYIIRCQDGRYYTGSTNDLIKRFRTHQAGRGAKFFRLGAAQEVVYVEALANRSLALKREALIKSLARSEKEGLMRQEGM